MTLDQIVSGQVEPPEHLVKALGKLALWAMGPGRTFTVTEVYGRCETSRAVRITLLEHGRRPRSWQIDMNVTLAEHIDSFLLDLIDA